MKRAGVPPRPSFTVLLVGALMFIAAGCGAPEALHTRGGMGGRGGSGAGGMVVTGGDGGSTGAGGAIGSGGTIGAGGTTGAGGVTGAGGGTGGRGGTTGAGGGMGGRGGTTGMGGTTGAGGVTGAGGGMGGRGGTTGMGGTTGAGGVTGAGGGMGGTTGAGGGMGGRGGAGGTGAGGAAGFACAMTPAPIALITDFTGWNTSTNRFTMTGGLSGGLFTYNNTGGTMMAVVDTTALNLHVTGTVQGYGGWGVYFDGCVSAAAYTGIAFTIAGSAGGCGLAIQLQMNSDLPIDTTNMRGSCAATCSLPVVNNVATTGTVMIPWTMFLGGTPNPQDPRELRAIQFQLTSATNCTPNFTLDDLKFY